jgi:hypothetical protein
MRNEMIVGVVVSVVTAAILGAGAWLAGAFERVSQADAKALIKLVIEEELKTDAGKTYSARLAEVGEQLTVIETRVSSIKEDVDDLEDAVLTLAGE